MFKKIFLTLVILAVIAFGGVSIYVSTIDWNLHKNKIAQQFEEISGKKVVFNGEVSLSFFPSPYLSAKNIKIYNKTENAQPLAVIDEMITELALVPLIKGNFVIENMSLLDADINIKFLPNGKLNWYSQMSNSQRNKLDSVEVALNSVSLKDASVHILNEGLGIDIKLQELNAEITAESLFGPYRIDGNFVKDNNPAGFALNLGSLSESFATSLNLVLTHPTTESYARFDGSMLSSNKEIKGNFIVESKQPSNFINGLTNQVILPNEFNYPLAFSIELITNEQQIDLSSFIIKYGEHTAGAGNILIPLKANSKDERRKIEAFFEMTELDLMPLIGVIKEQLKKFHDKKNPYVPNYDFDLITDIKAVKANFNDQIVRNFNFSADLVNDVITIKELSGLFAGDTDLKLSGDIFENEQNLSYVFNVKSLSQDFLKFLELINLKPNTYAQSTYRNASIEFDMSGNLNQIKIAPLKVEIDKTAVTGVMGFVKDKRTKAFIVLDIDNINLDNYIPKLSEEEMQLPFNERLKLVLNKLSFLNDYDLNIEAKLNLGIYDGVAFEKSSIKFETDKNAVKVKKFNIENIHNAVFNVSGDITDIGTSLHFKDIKYSFQSKKFKDFLKKINIPIPALKLAQDVQNINAKGIFTGNINNINIKAITSFDRLSSVYSGRLFEKENILNYKGTLEFRAPDFVEFVNNIGYNYKPQYMAANIFTFKGNIEGNANEWTAKDIDAFIGSNNFKGNVSVVNNNYPQINAVLHANKFEFDRFIYNPENTSIKQVKKTKTIDTSINFLKHPVFNTNKINYDIFKTFDLDGKFSADVFSINNEYFDNVKMDMNIKQGAINMNNIIAQKNEAPISGNLVFDLNATTDVKGNFVVSDYDISKIGGKKYEFISGKISADIQFNAPASSVADFVKGVNGLVLLDFSNVDFKGWDLLAIEEDVRHRTHSDNLYEMLRTNLQSGNSLFYQIKTDFEIKEGILNIKNTLMETNQANVSMIGTVNLYEWDINSDFSLTFNQLRDQIIPIKYKWTGALNNPNLVINSSELKDKYDSYWEKIRIETEAAEKARIQDLTDRMNIEQDKVTTLSDVLENDIFPRLEKYLPFSSNVTTRSKYESSNIIANDIKMQLDQLRQKSLTNFVDEDITQTHAKTEVFESQLNNMIRELDENYIIDLKNHSNNIHQSIKNVYDYSLKKGINYQNNLNVYVDRLIELKSLIILDNEPKAADYKNKIETSLRTIADLYNKSLTNKNDINQTNNISELEMQHKVMQETAEKVKEEMLTLNSSIQDLFDYAKEVVHSEEELAIKKQEALKAAQEGLPSAQENIIIDSNLEENKKKTKIIIVEEGQVPQNIHKLESEPFMEPNSQPEDNLLNIKEVEPNVIKENLPVVVSTKNNKARNPFAPMENKQIESLTEPEELSLSKEMQTLPLNTNEQEVVTDELLSSAQEEINKEQVNITPVSESEVVIEHKPIIKPIDNTASYRPKISTSGIITKPASSNKQSQIDILQEKPILKPMTGAEIISSGTITKRK